MTPDRTTQGEDGERAAIIAYLDRMKVEASELGNPNAVFWIVQIKRDIERGEHLNAAGVLHDN
ncbi:hypothetical protein SKP52_02785 [Sphingopyxis fribergensis]|uniref:Uncharacterized protein n=1 Tax=Sphingopyxis fribergensis TaxID=1515612 RepID=A0A0A7PHR0_9SPHN|nr:hypothetical protein [Sphingopyxis fribergensis]AJA07487.1 hypothetical protein SKP52_02785 [Sphingopyxis fribergensis]